MKVKIEPEGFFEIIILLLLLLYNERREQTGGKNDLSKSNVPTQSGKSMCVFKKAFWLYLH